MSKTIAGEDKFASLSGVWYWRRIKAFCARVRGETHCLQSEGRPLFQESRVLSARLCISIRFFKVQCKFQNHDLCDCSSVEITKQFMTKDVCNVRSIFLLFKISTSAWVTWSETVQQLQRQFHAIQLQPRFHAAWWPQFSRSAERSKLLIELEARSAQSIQARSAESRSHVAPNARMRILHILMCERIG